LTTPIPTRPPLREGFNVPPIQPTLPQKKSLGQLTSPSSPTLPRFTRPPTVARSQTLPRVFQLDNKPRRRQAELDQLALSPETTERIRRWIIGVAIVAEKRPPTKDGFIYGFSHFTQKKNPNSKRGYEQVKYLGI
ncbi:hypothetical protein C0992_007411, partial [Termitomyces sp. T32_za158]